MSEMLPNARLVVLQNASHFAPIETPQELNILILEFLAQLGGSKSVLAQSV
jgi:pimeloyl-ACP methyl ester carboxylesterase